MQYKRIIVCLDIRDGRTTKGIKFRDNADVGDPVEMAGEYNRQGADEIVLYDISASVEGRSINRDLIEKVAKIVTVPLCVGGGLASLDDIRSVMLAGAKKVSLNSAAVKNPGIIEEAAKLFGKKAVLLGMDALADKAMPSGYRVVIKGGREPMDMDAVAWARKAESLGAGEIVMNSIDADGVQDGYDVTLTRKIAEAVKIPVIASGGAGKPEHLVEVLSAGKADAALVASMVHYGKYTVGGLKRFLAQRGISVREAA